MSADEKGSLKVIREYKADGVRKEILAEDLPDGALPVYAEDPLSEEKARVAAELPVVQLLARNTPHFEGLDLSLLWPSRRLTTKPTSSTELMTDKPHGSEPSFTPLYQRRTAVPEEKP